MIKIFILLISISGIFYCQNKHVVMATSSTSEFQAIHNTYLSFQKCKDTIIDYAINQIGVNEYSSIKKKFGEGVLNQIKKSIDKNKEVWIQAQVLNKDKNKYFRLVLQEGAACCQYFEVGYNSKKISGTKLISSYKDFISDNAVKLNIDTVAFRKLLCCVPFNKINNGDTTTYNYSIRERDGNVVLDQIHYVCEYVFIKNKLIRFGFGNMPLIPRYLLRD